ncbi:MAG: alpha/beta fold hydrolase [Woeseiaceae bacterium]|nr:alpha/beta fold hydrolase [Woeseiaceae bacterium]
MAKRTRQWRLTALGLILAVANAGTDSYYAPTDTSLPFDFKSDASFDEYLETTKAYLSAHREFIRPNRKQAELELVMPFELRPADSCDGRSRGVLLVHGILDTPYTMRDIAEVLNGKCFLVRSLLLPGHGTRAGDLLTVTAEEWLAAVDYGVRSLKSDSDDVYIGGYSLGGLLAAHAAITEPEVRAALLFAPALDVTYPFLAQQSSWLRHLKEWLDKNPAPLPVRYQSMSTNAVAQIVKLVGQYDDRVGDGFDKPAFVVVTDVDIAVDSDKIVDEFIERFDHPLSRMEIYGDAGVELDGRMNQHESYLPEQRILNIAHMGIPYRDDDRYFGRDGAYRDCGQYLPIIPNSEVAACQRNDDNWRGELDSTEDEDYLPLQRLTYNPHFEETMQRMLRFIAAVENTNGEAQ